MMSSDQDGYIADKGTVDVVHSVARPRSCIACKETTMNRTCTLFPALHASTPDLCQQTEIQAEISLLMWLTAKGESPSLLPDL